MEILFENIKISESPKENQQEPLSKSLINIEKNIDVPKANNIIKGEVINQAFANLEKKVDVPEQQKNKENDAPEANDFILFESDSKQEIRYPCQKNINQKIYYYDSNGNLYRVDNDLVSDNVYEINGYKYETDSKGRIISAEGTLHLKDPNRKKLKIDDTMQAVGKGDQKDSDDRGHLIGDQFDGSNRLENLVPQNSHINQVDFKNFENELAAKIKCGKNVIIKVEPIYDSDSRRPDVIAVTYTIDGQKSIRIFPNNLEVK